MLALVGTGPAIYEKTSHLSVNEKFNYLITKKLYHIKICIGNISYSIFLKKVFDFIKWLFSVFTSNILTIIFWKIWGGFLVSLLATMKSGSIPSSCVHSY